MQDGSSSSRRLFFAIFTVSGFSGLIYEAIWSHYLKLFLGHAAYAQTLVLAIFMGGMALGAWGIARYSHRIVNLLLGYAVVEGAIGILGLLFHRTSVAATSWAFDSVLPALDSPLSAQLFKWSLGALLILPQSILLGMTFPLMSGAIVRRFPERSGATLAMLYFTNSLGAAVGVLVSGFILIAAVGLPGTILTAGLLNIALAMFVWGMDKRHPRTARSPQPVALPEHVSLSKNVVRAILIGAGVTGAAAFLYEIAWLRMLSLVLGSSTHSFEMMLSAFILGIALGGLWVHRRIDALADQVRFLANILMMMAAIALLSLPIYNGTFDLMSQVIQTFSSSEQGYVGISILSHAIAMLVMLPTTFFCGMTLPVMTNVLIRGGAGERAIGSVYAWNTAGAIAGVIVAVHFLMPTIGVKGLVITGAALHLSLGVVYRGLSGSSSSSVLKRLRVPAMVGAAGIVAAALFLQLDPAKLTSGVFRHGRASNADRARVLLLDHGKTATVSLTDSDGYISIATNGKPDATINMRAGEPSSAADEITMVLAGALPYALHPNPRRMATIGIGSGLTTQVLLANPAVQQVDTVEIEPAMANAARIGFMPRVARTFTDPRSHIHFEDAKTFFALNRAKYDVIVSEPSNPWVSGVATLFSQEFYRQITRYLEPDGLLVQWFQIYEADMDIVASVMKAMAPEFADFAVYNADDSNILIVASRSGTLPRSASRAFASSALQAELARVGLHRPEDIESRFLGDKKLLMPLLNASTAPPNSDYFPFVDLHAARARIMKHNAGEFTLVQVVPAPLLDLLDGVGPSRELTTPSPDAPSARDAMTLSAATISTAVKTARYDELPPATSRMLLALRSTDAQCADEGVQRAWLASAYWVAAQTTVPLSPAELKPLWDLIASTPCAAHLKAHDRELLALFQSAAARDATRAAASGSVLFNEGYAFQEPEQFAFALLTTAASAIAAGHPNVALDMMQRNASRVATTPSINLAFRWVTAIAVHRRNQDLAQTNTGAGGALSYRVKELGSE